MQKWIKKKITDVSSEVGTHNWRTKQLKNNKAPRSDRFIAEMLKEWKENFLIDVYITHINLYLAKCNYSFILHKLISLFRTIFPVYFLMSKHNFLYTVRGSGTNF